MKTALIALVVVLALAAAPAAGADTHVFSIASSPSTHIASTRDADGTTTTLRMGSTNAIAADGKHLYWSEQRGDGGAIGRMDVDGANIDPNWLTGLSHGMGQALAVAPGHVCWTTSHSQLFEIGCVPVNADGSHGAPVQGVVTDQSMNGFAIDAGHLYWGRATSINLPGTIARANIDGSNVQNDFIPNVTYPRGIAVNADRIFFTETHPQSASPPPATIKTALLSGGAPLAIVTLPGDTPLGPIAVNGDRVYWTEGSTTMTIGRATLTGSDQNHAFATPGGLLLGLATEQASSDTLDVDLSASSADGRPLDSGGLTEQESFNVRVTLKNTSSTATIKDLAYAGGAPLTIDGRSIARIGILSAPAGALPSTLGPGESATFDYALTVGTDGVAAAIVKVTGKGDDGTPEEATGSLKLTVTQAGRLNAALAQWVRVRGVDRLMLGMARKLYQGWDKRGLAMRASLRKALSPAEYKRWFGTTGKKFVADNLDVARALLLGRSPNATAAQFPNKGFGGYTAEELYDEYNKAFKAELGRGASKYVKKWSDLGSGAKRQVQLAYAESGLAVNYIMNTASQDQREEAEAMVLAFSDGVVDDTTSYANWTKNEVSNLLNDGAALITAFDQVDQGADDAVDAMTVPLIRDAEARDRIAQYAGDQPIKFMRESAKLDASYANTGAEIAADTLLGGAATKLVTSTGKAVQVGKKGAALLNMAKATDVVDESGKLVKGVHAVKDTKKALGVGMAGEEVAAMFQDGEAALRDTAGATLVQSSDYGNVYKLPNVGGVPEVTLDSKAAILKSVEEDYAKTFGRPIELAEVLKPSTELRKPGAVAKLELTGQKTGKAAMVDAGMPPDALGEAVLWKPKVKPQEIPGFSQLSESRQAAAIKEYENALKLNKEWKSPAPGSKTAKLKQVIGKEGTVPLDDKPWPDGLQRFVNAEFELVKVPGKYADAYLIRVKKYEIAVKDTLRGGKVVNTKTVVNSTKALAQGVDADAVGLAKVVGRDAAGKPVLGPLDASERSFAMSRYIDRNVKARAAGLQTDLAEHGATLIMDDADAAHAGFLLPKFGVPFMPDDVGIPFLQRIAKFVAPKGTSPELMFLNMVEAVQKEGGFGQHAVVLTKDTRYLGDVLLQSW